jgi:transcriptional regulator with XRE-family HTH domain
MRNTKKYTKVGRRIAALARRQKDIARTLGISQQSVSKKLRGETAILLSDLEALSEAYNVPLTYFFEEGPAEPAYAIAADGIRKEPGPLRELVVVAWKLRLDDRYKLLAIAKTLSQ